MAVVGILLPAIADEKATDISNRRELFVESTLIDHLEGSTVVGTNAQIGPDVFAVDTAVGEGSVVWYSVLRSAEIGANCEVGPYASLRPGTVLKDNGCPRCCCRDITRTSPNGGGNGG